LIHVPVGRRAFIDVVREVMAKRPKAI